MGRVVISGSLGGVMVITLILECNRFRFDSHSRHHISHLYHTHDTHYRDHDPVQVICHMVVEPTLCVYIDVRALPVCM